MRSSSSSHALRVGRRCPAQRHLEADCLADAQLGRERARVVLVEKAELLSAEVDELFAGEPADVNAVDVDAAGGQPVQPGDHSQQRGLSGAAGSRAERRPRPERRRRSDLEAPPLRAGPRRRCGRRRGRRQPGDSKLHDVRSGEAVRNAPRTVSSTAISDAMTRSRKRRPDRREPGVQHERREGVGRGTGYLHERDDESRQHEAEDRAKHAESEQHKRANAEMVRNVSGPAPCTSRSKNVSRSSRRWLSTVTHRPAKARTSATSAAAPAPSPRRGRADRRALSRRAAAATLVRAARRGLGECLADILDFGFRHGQPELARRPRAWSVGVERSRERAFIGDDELLALADRRKVPRHADDPTGHLRVVEVECQVAAGPCGHRDRGARDHRHWCVIGHLTPSQMQVDVVFKRVRDTCYGRRSRLEGRPASACDPAAPAGHDALPPADGREQRSHGSHAGPRPDQTTLVHEVQQPRASRAGQRHLERDDVPDAGGKRG